MGSWSGAARGWVGLRIIWGGARGNSCVRGMFQILMVVMIVWVYIIRQNPLNLKWVYFIVGKLYHNNVIFKKKQTYSVGMAEERNYKECLPPKLGTVLLELNLCTPLFPKRRVSRERFKRQSLERRRWLACIWKREQGFTRRPGVGRACQAETPACVRHRLSWVVYSANSNSKIIVKVKKQDLWEVTNRSWRKTMADPTISCLCSSQFPKQPRR